MFFIIAGIQPKTITLDDRPRMCHSCGLYQARLIRINHYLSVFFIPVFRVKKGESFLECRSCGAVSSESGEIWPGTRTGDSRLCPHCKKTLERGFRFCPYCGKEV